MPARSSRAEGAAIQSRLRLLVCFASLSMTGRLWRSCTSALVAEAKASYLKRRDLSGDAAHKKKAPKQAAFQAACDRAYD
jgi:hypothetical protein